MNFHIFVIFILCDMMNFAFKILSELGALTTVSSTLCKTDSEMLTGSGTDRGSVRNRPGPGSGAPLTYFFCSYFNENCFAYVSNDFKQKKIFHILFLAKHFFIFIESSETNFALVANKTRKCGYLW